MELVILLPVNVTELILAIGEFEGFPQILSNLHIHEGVILQLMEPSVLIGVMGVTHNGGHLVVNVVIAQTGDIETAKAVLEYLSGKPNVIAMEIELIRHPDACFFDTLHVEDLGLSRGRAFVDLILDVSEFLMVGEPLFADVAQQDLRVFSKTLTSNFARQL